MSFTMRYMILLPLLLVVCQTGHAAGEPPSDRAMAESAVSDLLTHFWVGNPATGHVLDTYNGYIRTDDPRGILWERATFISVLANLYEATHDEAIKVRLAADWKHLGKEFQPWEVQTCGDGTENVGQDDAGWTSLMLLSYYKVLRDPVALKDAEGLVDHAFARWGDDQLGGGLWYNDKRQFKSTYETA